MFIKYKRFNNNVILIILCCLIAIYNFLLKWEKFVCYIKMCYVE